MGLITFFLLVLFAITSFYLGYFRSNRVRVIEKQRPFSLDKYYGYYLAIWSVVPAVIILFAILIFDGFIVKNYVLSEFYSQGIDQSEISLLFTQIENTRNGIKLFNSEDEIIVNAVNKLNYIEGIFDITSIITVFSVSSLFLLYGYRKINLNFDARLIVEKFILIGFFLCSLIAILVTVGIIFSLLYETVRFFSQVPILDFLFESKRDKDSGVVIRILGGLASCFFFSYGVVSPFLISTVISLLKCKAANCMEFFRSLLSAFKGVINNIFTLLLFLGSSIFDRGPINAA